MRIICNILITVSILSVIFYAKADLRSDNGSAPIKPNHDGIYMKADKVEYDANKDMIAAEGNIIVFAPGYKLIADKIYYDVVRDVIFAEGNIKVYDSKNRIVRGERAVFTEQTKKGIISEFILRLEDNSILLSRLAYRLSENRVILHKSSFTPCKIVCGQKPTWQIDAEDTDIDFDKQTVTYRNLFFEVYGIPVVFLPYFFHPTPNAPAKSGLLTPKIYRNDFVQPFYFRLKPNWDLTISPRISTKYTIFELENRHRLEAGQYNIRGSYGNPTYQTSTNNTKPSRYHVFADGIFYKDDLQYGFNVKRASDKAYLKNYYNIYDSHLQSKVFVNKINDTDYFSAEGAYFQGFRSEDKGGSMPIVFPSIRTLNVVDLNDTGDAFLTVRNYTLAYNKNFDDQIIRSAFDIAASQRIQTNQGHLLFFTLSDRADIYFTSFTDTNKGVQENIWYRNIPQLESKWSYPMITSIGQTISLKLEPIVSAITGKKYDKKYNKFGVIDTAKYELDDHNIFYANRFSGVDFHEFGNRLNYGLGTALLSDNFYIDSFLGQALHKNNVINSNNSEYVGNFSINFPANFELFYRFRKDKTFDPIRDEVGIISQYQKVNTAASFVSLNNISRYYAEDGFIIDGNKAKQITFNVTYEILPSITVGSDIISYITKNNKLRLINKTIRMTYNNDCVSISFRLFDDYTEDNRRGLKKQHNQTFSVGLKVINM